jgi:hypothetical protein
MSIIAIVLASLSGVAFALLLIAAIDDKRHQQRIAERHWHEVEHE